MAGGWFETVAEAERRAARRLPRSVHMALLAGTENATTLRGNVAAFDEIGWIPHVVDLPMSPDLSTTVMGQSLSMPVLISPTGVQAVHPEAELAVARAAASRGVAMSLGSFGSKPVEEVTALNPQTFFQTYWSGPRESILHRINRAKQAGAVGLILTLDWTFAHRRDWGSPKIPAAMNLRTMIEHAPEILLGAKFAYLWSWVRTLHLPPLSVPNMSVPGQPTPGFFAAYGEWMQTPQPTWDDISWLREQWDGPFLVKGICRVEDARAAVAAGATAISVSNHGGNNLDGTPAAIRLLPAIARAVGDEVEVLMDGGIRRGSDVAKAVALGARAVLIGRAYLWGLAANGQAGVENVLDILRGGLVSALMGLRKASIAELRPDDLVIPPGFLLEQEDGRTTGAGATRARRPRKRTA